MVTISITFSIPFLYRHEKKAMPRQRKVSSGEAMFSSFARQQITLAAHQHHHSLSANYATALRSLLTFYNKEDIPFSALDSTLVERYRQWLKDRGVCLNTTSCYMRSLRALYNKAVYQHKTRQRHPFALVFTGNTKTEARSVCCPDMERLQSLPLSDSSPLRVTRDVFLFSFFAMGMPFVDVAYLRWSQIQDGVITYHRHKTGQRVRVRLESCMKKILQQYKVSSRDYVFPLITSASVDGAYREYRTALGRYNRHLKKLGIMTGSGRPLTSYVARHTWASLAYRENIDIKLISEALGHTSVRTTQIYISSDNRNKLFAANKRLLGKIKMHTSSQEVRIIDKIILVDDKYRYYSQSDQIFYNNNAKKLF